MDSKPSVHGGLEGSHYLSGPVSHLNKNPVKPTCGTPMSQASTVPPTPDMGFTLDPPHFGHSRVHSLDSVMSGELFLDDLPPFGRVQSIDEEEELVDEDGMRWEVTRGTVVPVKSSVTEEEVEQRRVPAGGRFRTLSRAHHKSLARQYRPRPAPAMSALEAQLAEVKALFKRKTGKDVDEPDEENLVDEDGMRWTVTRGTGVPAKTSETEEVEQMAAPSGGRFRTLSRKHHIMLEREYLQLPAPKISDLEAQLADVKALFKRKTGEDVDDEDEEIPGVQTVGTGIPAECSLTEEEVEHKSAPSGGRFQTLSRSHHKALEREYLQLPAPEMSSLEKQLAEVKALFKQKTGEDVDDEDEEIPGVQILGTGIPAKCSLTEEQVEHKSAPSGGRFQTLSRSHHKMLERQYLQLPAPEISSLEKQLAEVKGLFKQKTGQDVDDEDEFDEDGMQWMKTAGTGQRTAGGRFQTLSRSHHKALEREYLQLPVPEMSSLEKQLAEVKALFKQKTGQDVDDEDEEDDLVDEDGMRWTVTRGTGVQAKSSVTEEEVEQKRAPAGGKFQTLSCSHHKALEREYLQLRAPEMSDLWKQLSEVKALFYQKTGQDVDDDEEDLVDEDGMRWEVTRGTGQRAAGGRFQTLSRSHHKALEREYLQLPAPEMPSLEKQLAEVKALFKRKTGQDVDDEDEENLLDEDGMRWVVTRGTHVPVKSSVTEEEVEHKSAPSSGGKFQTFSRKHQKMLARRYAGQVPEMDSLEEQLSEVKALFKQKTGEDVDDEDEENLVDEDGMRWVVTRGTHVPVKSSLTEEEVEHKSASSGGKFQTLSLAHHEMLKRQYGPRPVPEIAALEAQLAEVKALFKQKTGESVDDAVERGCVCSFLAGWQKLLFGTSTRRPVPEMSSLEAQLAEVKALFKQKTGQDVDEEVDEDGMRWVVTRGTGVPSRCSVTEEQVEQKAAPSGGRFQTLKRSHHKKLAWEYALKSGDMVDEDGMRWTVTRGTGVPAKTSVTEEEVEHKSAPSSGGKFQTFSRKHQRRLARRYAGQVPEMDSLEEQLSEVKTLFEQESGQDVDAED